MPTNQPKLTMTQLNEQQKASAKAIEDIQTILRRVEWTAGEAKRLASGHVAGINKVHTLERSFLGLKAQIEATNGQMTESVENEVARLKEKLSTLESDLRVQLTTLRERVEEHETTIADHSIEIGMLTEGQKSLHGRVTVLERFEGFPKKRAITALIIGAVVMVLWLVFADFGQNVSLPDGKTTFHLDYSLANSWLGALLAGIVTAGLIMSLSLLLPSKTKQTVRTTETVSQSQPTPVIAPAKPAPPRTPIASRSVSDEPAPTKVITTSGASSGTH